MKSDMQPSRWRKMFWPVYGEENKKFVPMLLMLALALFNYTSLRISKDALIMTAPYSGGGVLNFLKGYIVFPASILFAFFYGVMSDNVSKKNLFYVTLLPFLGFFVLFGLVLYPFADYLHASPAWLKSMQDLYPNYRYILPIFAYWGFSSFYVFSELWGNVVITLLFWNFANLNTTKDEVKRFYPLFGTYSNFGLILAGVIQYYGISTDLTCFLVISSALLIGLVYWYVTTYVIEQEIEKVIVSKKKVSFTEGLKIIFSSKYLALIAILVLAYGMTANLVEITWKEIIKGLYPVKEDYTKVMGQFFIATGVSTMLIGFFVKNVVGKFGWLTGALITPIVLLTTSIAFYGFTLFSDYLMIFVSMIFSASPLVIAGIVGAFQNIASKATKYSLFDPTTQMTYIPLEDNLRVKGKAAVDVIGGRLGKSLGGHIQSIALFLTGWSQTEIAPILLAILVVISIAWIYATIALSKEYKLKLSEKEGVV